ncbi:DUF2971 domain-containing protein [Paenibacillus barengoltzii]|uniref:DUF2971 domain-containing protein n=1 Tax=Paenibacillus barengoltzii TaxID=343517 RepID=UPI000A0839BE|nr:DUF2971 domain-containing protein [Paenibacillus barengoltzii]SMF67814.1 Protein of unknown function [Paenibacillus barengoltzii]
MPYYTDDFMCDVMRIENIPDFLYHYTSLETLACILKYKTLRFTRLDKVNDKNEALSKDIKNANTLVFVSCWTGNANESIPMWSMYTTGMNGVRIKAPTNLFTGRRKPVVYERGGARLYFDSDPYVINRVPPALGLIGRSIVGPNKVHYSNDSKYLNVSSISKYNDRVVLDFSDLGMFKDLNWAHEEEWRYRIVGMMDADFSNDSFFNEVTIDLIKYPVIPEYIDVKLDEEVFSELEITTGPKMTDPQYILLEGVIEKYAPNITINKSNLKIR